jgi:hypothetical protein
MWRRVEVFQSEISPWSGVKAILELDRRHGSQEGELRTHSTTALLAMIISTINHPNLLRVSWIEIRYQMLSYNLS